METVKYTDFRSQPGLGTVHLQAEKAVLTQDGYLVEHPADSPRDDRKGVNGRPGRAGMYCDERENNPCMRLIDYAHGLTEPRRVRSGPHAAVALQGSAR